MCITRTSGATTVFSGGSAFLILCLFSFARGYISVGERALRGCLVGRKERGRRGRRKKRRHRHGHCCGIWDSIGVLAVTVGIMAGMGVLWIEIDFRGYRGFGEYLGALLGCME